MNPNSKRVGPPDLSHFHENWLKFPQEELAKYWGKQVAVSPDGTRIVASGDTLEELDAARTRKAKEFTTENTEKKKKEHK